MRICSISGSVFRVAMRALSSSAKGLSADICSSSSSRSLVWCFSSVGLSWARFRMPSTPSFWNLLRMVVRRVLTLVRAVLPRDFAPSLSASLPISFAASEQRIVVMLVAIAVRVIGSMDGGASVKFMALL